MSEENIASIGRGIRREDIVEIPQALDTLLVQAELMSLQSETITHKVFKEEEYEREERILYSADLKDFYGIIFIFSKKTDSPVKEAAVMGIDPISKSYFIFSGEKQQNISPQSLNFDSEIETALQKAKETPCKYLTEDYFEQTGSAAEMLPVIRGYRLSLILE